MDQSSSGSEPAGGFDAGRLKDARSWRRSRSDRMAVGVCGGIARALDVDPVLIRVVMGVLVVTGPGLLFYAAAWALMPDEGSDRFPAQGLLGDRVRPDHPWLWPVVIGGCVLLTGAVMSSFEFGRVVPGPVIVVGLLWLVVVRRKGRCRGAGSPGDARWAGQPGAPAAEPTAPSSTAPYAAGGPAPTTDSTAATTATPVERRQDRAIQDHTVQDRRDAPVQPGWTEDDPLGLYDDPPPTSTSTSTEPPPAGRKGVKSVVVLLTGVTVAIAWLAGSSTPAMLAIGLGTLGLGMLVGGFLGRTLALLPLGILLAVGVLATSVSASVPRDFTETRFAATPDRPITATNATYRFDAGSVRLDLTKATFAPGATVLVDGGVGEVVVMLPADVDVVGALSARGGDLRALGRRSDGRNPGLTVSDLGADGRAGPQRVDLDLDLRFGSITVERR